MNIRSKIYGSSQSEEPILRGKQPKGAKSDELQSIAVPREESRRGNSRAADRHRLSEEDVRVTHAGVSHEVQLVNLSGGGAMVRGGLNVKLWDRVELYLGEHGMIECAVRWLRGDRIGLEFAHETRLDCSSDEAATVLRDVIARSFPDMHFAEGDYPPAPRTRSSDHRGEPRHPLIWSGVLHLDNQSTTVRVRNISSAGAMIECSTPPHVGTEPVLDLNDKAALSSTVQWVVGDQLGLHFHRPFDMQLLSRSKPDVAPAKWVRPAYLAMGSGDSDSPWDPNWGRMTMSEISEELEGFLKR
ncbi:MAG TPA: PilZ domain-containing protein [Sphingomicrobium sp.]|nr:PilZ domain-containing protein [Sphingomicrobium sp.]